jgi:hypothetical protein
VGLELQEEMAFILGLNADDDSVEGKAGEYIKTLWADPGIQAAYDMRAKFQLNDSAA